MLNIRSKIWRQSIYEYLKRIFLLFFFFFFCESGSLLSSLRLEKNSIKNMELGNWKTHQRSQTSSMKIFNVSEALFIISVSDFNSVVAPTKQWYAKIINKSLSKNKTGATTLQPSINSDVPKNCWFSSPGFPNLLGT